MNNYLINPKKKKKSLKIKDFAPYTNLALNVSTSDGIKPALGYDVSDWGLNRVIEKGYFICDSLFIYGADKWLYQLRGSSFVRRFESKTFQPIFTNITVNGENVAIALCGGVGYVFKNSMEVVSTPKANSACEYKGRMFFANENLVYYGNTFDYDNFSHALDGYGYFNFDKRDGEILKIITYDDCILVFCNKAIYKIYTNTAGEFFTKKLNNLILNIKADTIEKVGNEVLFISNGKLLAYKDEVLTVIDNLDNYYIVQGSGAVANFNQYTLSVTNSEGQKAIFVYDVESKEPFLIENSNLVMLGNGYAFDNQLSKIIEFGKEKQNIPKVTWQSKKIDFSTVKYKSLTEIRLFVNGKGSLKIKGDFGERDFSLNKEYMTINPNLYSKYFIFEIMSDERDFSVKNMQLECNL